MSRHDEARYQIERQRRQDLFNQRVRETTRTYLARYRGILEDVQSQGLNEYVQAEFSELERELASLTRLVESDPAAARDRSIELGRQVHALPRPARGMRQAYVEAQRQAEEAAREEARRIEARGQQRCWWRDDFSETFGTLTKANRPAIPGQKIQRSLHGLRGSIPPIGVTHGHDKTDFARPRIL